MTDYCTQTICMHFTQIWNAGRVFQKQLEQLNSTQRNENTATLLNIHSNTAEYPRKDMLKSHH